VTSLRRAGAAVTVAFAVAATTVLGGSGTATAVGRAPSIVAAAACTPGSVQLTTDVPAALSQLQSTAAWKYATGVGILVAVVDSGIDASNPHLAGVVVGGVNLVGDGANASGLSDVDGHGTAIAGEIAARRIPGSGVVGLAPDAHLLSVRVFRGTDDQSVAAGFGPSVSKLSEGIIYAAQQGAKVINVSLSDFTQDGGLSAAVAYASAHGALVVASAGNRATTTDKSNGERYPAGDPGALGVAASNGAGVVTSDSIHGPQVAVSAPGSEILTSATGAGDCTFSGTTPASSYATAYVSAAAALVAQAHPTETPAQWAYRLEATASRTDRDARNDVSGWGVIQPADAITLVPTAQTRGPVSPFASTSGNGVTPPAVSVAPDSSSSPLEVTLQSMAYAGIGAATLLGALGVIVVYRRRRPRAGSIEPL
jgi:membrane-anchored mycosin MYCP